MNPRETVMDNLLDEFANDQSSPLEYQSPILSTSSSHFYNFSVHSSHHASIHSSQSGRGMAQILSLTQTELEQLQRFIVKMTKLSEIYLSAHPVERELKSQTGSITPMSKSAQHSLSRSKKLASEELRICYREVPEIFFRSNFTLANQEIFNQALLIFDLSRSNSQQSDLQSIEFNDSPVEARRHQNPRFQDNLSYYMDLVEVALLRQIWSRSPAFFRALDDLKGLQYEVYEAIQVLLAVRKKLHVINEKHTKQSLRIPKLSRRQKNEYLLQTKLHYMRRLVEGRNAILSLLECEDYFSAQELIYSIKDIHSKHLRDIRCMKEIGSQLNDFHTVIYEVLCNKFASYGIQWEATESRDSSNSKSIGYEYEDELEALRGDISSGQEKLAHSEADETRRLIQSLLAGDQFHIALGLYRNRLMDGIKLIIRTCVMEYMSGTDPANLFEEGATSEEAADTVPFVQRIREMSSEHFLSCLSMCFEHLTLSLKKAKLFHDFVSTSLVEMLATAMNSGDPRIKGEDSLLPTSLQASVSLDSSSGDVSFLSLYIEKFDEKLQQEYLQMSKLTVQNVVEIIQKSIIQLINFRKDINSKFSIEKMIFLWEISLQFVSELESCSGNNAFALRQCLLMQTKLFLEALHETSKTRLVNALDNERWVQCDVAADRQAEIDRLASGKAFLQSSLSQVTQNTQSSGFSEAKSVPSASSPEPSASSTALSASGKKARDKDLHPAVVGGQEYRVVWSVLLLIEIILSYLDIAFHFPPITNDIINKIVELIRLFNTRTKQLVLGAQAIQSAARLKSISAKHLAITSQSLGLFIALLPHIRAALLAQLNPSKQSVLSTEIDRISQDLFDHHSQIMSKFVNIVSDMVEQSAVVKLKGLDWDRFQVKESAAAAGPSPAPQTQQTLSSSGPQANGQPQCEYFEDIQKNVVTLHKVLISLLPNEQIQDIFTRIFSLLNRKLVAHFDEIMPNTATGKQRILDEVTHFVSTLARLKAVDSTILTGQLEDAFRKKYSR